LRFFGGSASVITVTIVRAHGSVSGCGSSSSSASSHVRTNTRKGARALMFSIGHRSNPSMKRARCGALRL
jgi:hypothetical protein